MVASRHYVITGGPGVGKTTIVGRLKKLGYLTVPEAAEQIIEEQKNQKYPITVKNNFDAFERLIIQRQLLNESRSAHVLRNNTAFFDRSLIDCLGYYKNAGIDAPEGFEDSVQSLEYAKVFVLDRLDSYEDNGIRHENPEEAAQVHQVLVDVYESVGHKVITVPDIGKDKRVQFILDHIGDSDGFN